MDFLYINIKLIMLCNKELTVCLDQLWASSSPEGCPTQNLYRALSTNIPFEIERSDAISLIFDVVHMNIVNVINEDIHDPG